MTDSKQRSEMERYFCFKARKGLSRLLQQHNLDKEEYEKRLEYELEVICDMGFPGYFLIVADFISWSKKNNIMIGPGRGSAAGSLVCWALGITGVDPIKYGLLFERFLNPGRVGTFPDIDVDIQKDKRYLVIEYVREKYGSDYVAQIGTFGQFKAKAAIRGAQRVLQLPLDLANQLNAIYPEPEHGKPVPFEKAFKQNPVLAKKLQEDSDEGRILRLAVEIENRVSQFGIHAAGVVIGNRPLHETVPLARGRSDETVTQWNMHQVEDVGLIKFDFLGLKMLTLLQQALSLIEEKTGDKIDLYSLSLDDEDTYATLRRGENVGIFQLESSEGIRDLCAKIKPENIEDITALVASFRPGPLGSEGMQQYLDWRAGISEPTYHHEDLEPILKETGGWCIYQDELISLEEGGVCPIKDLAAGTKIQTGRGTLSTVKKVWKTGSKPVYEYIVDNGLSCRLTKDHIVPSPIGDLPIGEAPSVLIPRKNLSFGKPDPKRYPWLLGLCIADGCLGDSTPRICVGDEKFISYVEKALSVFSGEIKTKFVTRAWYVSSVNATDRSESFISFLRKYDLFGKTKNDKILPEECLSWSRDEICKLIAGMFEGDGCIHPNGVFYTTTNPVVLSQLATLLDGLRVTYYFAPNRLYIRDTELFNSLISPFLRYKSMEDTNISICGDILVSKKLFSKLLREKADALGTSLNKVQKICGLNNSFLWNNKKTAVKLKTVLRTFPEKREEIISKFIRGNYRVSNISEVKSLGTQDVYDLEIEDPEHLFVAGSFVVHNCIYQESVLQIAKELAGYTLAEADLLRRAVGKKDDKKMAEHEQKFKDGMRKNDYSSQLANTLWEEIKAFADYGFNKSHALAYSVITYWSAYLKTHYPEEFMAAALTCDKGNQDQMIIYIQECKRLGIEIKPPDVNESHSDFTPTGDGIRYGFSAIKNVGDKAAQHIVDIRKLRPFRDFFDFANRIDPNEINKKALTSLVYAGALDFTGKNRYVLLEAIEALWDYRKKHKLYLGRLETYEAKLEKAEQRKIDIENGVKSDTGKKLRPLKVPPKPEPPEMPTYIDLPDMPLLEKLKTEKEYIGHFISGNPLEHVKAAHFFGSQTIRSLGINKPETVELVALISEVKVKDTRNKQRMAIVRIEDRTATAELTIFPSMYKAAQPLLESRVTPYRFRAKVEYTEAEPDETDAEIGSDRVIPSLILMGKLVPIEAIQSTSVCNSITAKLDDLDKLDQLGKLVSKSQKDIDEKERGEELILKFKTNSGDYLLPTKSIEVSKDIQSLFFKLERLWSD